ncbi:MAG: TonB-dependent receptor [Bacteroidota bacterium]
MKIKCTLIAFCCLFCTTAFAQNVLKGTVTDGGTGETLIGANLFLASDFSVGTQTDVDGTYAIQTTAEQGTLVISYIGYEDQMIDFQSTDQDVDVKMVAKATALETVVVKGDKLSGQVFAVERLNKLDVYLNPSAQADPLKAVQSNPASTNVDETANISLRGSPASETGIFLNNVPINDVVRLDQSNGVGQFSIFNTSTLESVNVFASNPPLEFGNATSGVVALYTDDDILEDANSISVNLVGLGASISRQLTKKTSLTAFTNWNNPYLLKGINQESLKDLNDFTTLDFGAYGVHQFNENWQFKFFNYAIIEDYQYQTRFPSFSDQFQQNKKRNISVLNLIQQKETTRFEWNQGINFSNANYQVGNIDIHTRNFDYFSGLNYAWYPENGSVKVGLNTNVHRIASEGTAPLFNNGFSDTHPTTPFSSEAWVVIPEAFVFTKWTLGEDFTIGLGGRYHPELDGLESYASYQTNFSYVLNKHHQLIASVGEYHKFQLPNGESSQIQKLFSRQYSLDYQGNHKKFKWSAAVYHKDALRNNQPNIIYGAELFGAYQGQRLVASVSIASIQSTLKNGEIEYPSNQDLSYFFRSMVQYKINGLWDIGIVYWQRQGRYYRPVSSSYFDEQSNTFAPIYAPLNEGDRIPDYHRFDLSISRIIGLPYGSAIIYANANNLLDIKNVRSYNYNEDYSEPFAEYLNRRVLFFGVVFNW